MIIMHKIGISKWEKCLIITDSISIRQKSFAKIKGKLVYCSFVNECDYYCSLHQKKNYDDDIR
jgi:hypothetical protein